MELATLILASLALASRALAQTWVVGGRDPSDGPANATGASTFRGPDLSTPDRGPDVEHEVSIAVYAEIAGGATHPGALSSVPNLKLRDVDAIRPGMLSSVSVVKLRDTDAGNAEDGWSVCLNVWEAGPDVPGGGRLDDPGDCSAVLPEACRMGFPSSHGQDTCSVPRDLTDECSLFLGSGIATSREIGDSNPIFASWSAPFDPADDTTSMEAYAAGVNKVWIMQLAWSRQDGPDTTFTRFSGPVCFQANHIAEGSVDPRGRDEDGDGGDDDEDGDVDDGEGDSGSERRGVGALAGWGAAVALMLFIFL